MLTAKLDCLIFICFLRGNKHKNLLSPSRIYPILYVGRYVRSPRSGDRCPGTKIQESTQPVPGEAPILEPLYTGIQYTVYSSNMIASTVLYNSGGAAALTAVQPEYGDEQADAGRVCRTRLARPSSQARTGTGKYSFSLFS